MCQRIGRPPISTIGFGFVEVSSESLVPRPPASMTAFIAKEEWGGDSTGKRVKTGQALAMTVSLCS